MATPAQKLDTLGYAVKFFASEQGRDKFNKVVQYAARLFAWHLLNADPKSEWGKRWKGLFAYTRDARKLVRIFKTLNEYQKIQALVGQDPSLKQGIQLIGALGLSFYWAFDNLIYLAKADFLAKDRVEIWGKLSNFGWWTGITSAVIIDVWALTDNFAKEEKIKKQLQAAKSTPDKSEDADKLSKELKSLYAARSTLYLNFPKNFGDWLISANGWNLPANTLGSNFNDGVIGLAGITSGSIVIYSEIKKL